MADFKYIMQGFQKDINFFDEIKEVLETEDYTSIWILTAFVNERAICNLMPSIKKSKADISFIIGIRNNVSTYQALKCLINMKVSVFVFDTARIESIFHAKVIVGSGTNSAKVICGSANITTGGLANNIEAGIISKLNLRCESDERLNECIIRLERKKTSQYRLLIVDSLKKYQEILERHEKNKPQEIKKPDEKEENIQYQEKLKEIDKEITELNQKVEQNRDELTKINEAIGETEQIIAKLRVLRSEFGDIKEELNVYLKKYQLEIKEDFCLKDPLEIIEQYKNKLITDKTIKQLTLNGSPMEKGLLNELKIAHDKKNDLISTSDIEEKKYQKYLNDLQDWEKEKQKIIGSQDTEDCLTYYKSEKEYLDNILETDYHRAREERNIKFKELFVLKQRIVIIYQEIYAPIEQEIKKLLGDLEETIEFQAEMQLMDNDFSNKILSSISQRFAGVFKGKTEANNRITRLLRSTEFSDENSVLDLVNSIILAVDEDIDNSEKKITDKKEFYDYLYGLEYVGVSFKLKMGGRDLEELSPGERGIVLLIFYLALSQNSIPIIIDQPEDNLDNQSVYNKLVPCICAAKQKRQVIIVTHNPNIAVACDAEQIICCKMDKNTHKITYLSGAIEDQEIKQNVVDILEGTMPAFDLRRRKYV